MVNVGMIGSLLLTFCSFPELVRTIKEKECHIGWGFLNMWFFGEILCLFYGYNLNEIPLIINYSFNLVIAGVMIFYKLKSKKN